MTVQISGLTEVEASGIETFEKPPAGSWTEQFGLDTGPIGYEDSFSSDFYEDEKEAVFRRSWLNVGRVDDVPRKGSYFTKELRFLNASLLIIRGMDDEIRAFHNVCAHRGNQLVWDDFPGRETKGTCRAIACKYHGWRYGLDGSIQYVHNAAEFFDLDPESLALPKVHLEIWAGFIFINLEEKPRQTLREFLTPAVTKLESYPFEKMTQKYVMEATINSNWKLFLDAFQEVYHVPYVHGKLNNPAGPATGVDKVPFMIPFFGKFGKHRLFTSAANMPMQMSVAPGHSMLSSRVGSSAPNLFQTSAHSAMGLTQRGFRNGDWTRGRCIPILSFYAGPGTGTSPTTIGQSKSTNTSSYSRCTSCRRKTPRNVWLKNIRWQPCVSSAFRMPTHSRRRNA